MVDFLIRFSKNTTLKTSDLTMCSNWVSITVLNTANEIFGITIYEKGSKVLEPKIRKVDVDLTDNASTKYPTDYGAVREN